MQQGVEEEPEAGWSSAPREALLHVFAALPLHDRAFTVAAVCTWWRQVALEGELVPELNLCRAPLFALRAEQLPDHGRQLASFLCWLAPRAPRIRACILQAERWQVNEDSTSCWAFLHATDGGSGEQLRLATAQLLGPHLRALKLVSQGGGRATSAFLERGSQLQQLTLDFWGAGNVLPRTLSHCTALAVLRVQCSARLGGCGGFAGLRSLRELMVADSDWNRIPPEVAGLPHLTKLLLRFADFEAADWLPVEAVRGAAGAAAGPAPAGMARSLQDLALHSCLITALPPRFSALTALTALRLDRNGSLAELPAAALSGLRHLSLLSLEGCRSLGALGPGSAELPLSWLNIKESGVRELPAEPCTASLTTLHWEPCRPDSLAGAAGAVPQAWDLLARLPGIRHAHRLEELYLGGDVEGVDLERGAAMLFDELPALGKVCVPQSGLAVRRQQVAA